MTQQNEQKSGEKSISELRERYRKAHLTHQRIHTHIAKVCDGRHTYLSDNGIALLQAESSKLLQEIKEIEAVFKEQKWAL